MRGLDPREILLLCEGMLNFLISMRLKRLYSFWILALILGLSACAPNIASRGNIMDPDKLAEIKVGTSTREQVATTLGTPTVISTFDDKVWYYVGRQTKQYSFLDPETTKQDAYEICFDEQGVVIKLTKLDLASAHDIEPVDRATPARGNDNTFIRQLLGNLSHPVPKTSSGQGGP